MSADAYTVYKGEQYTYDAPKEDWASTPVECEVCGKLIDTDEPSFRNWQRYIHIACAKRIIGQVPA